MLPFVIVCLFRGNVGTDLFSYEHLVALYSRPNSYNGSEPLFYLMVRWINSITNDNKLTMRVVSGIISAIFIIFFLNSRRGSRFVFCAVIFPTLFISYTMNVNRIGLATAIYMLAGIHERRALESKALIRKMVSVGFHYSAAFFIGMDIFDSRAKNSRHRLLISTGIIAGLVIGSYFLSSYLEGKFSMYRNFSAPSAFSGLSLILEFSGLGYAILSMSTQVSGSRGTLVRSSVLFFAFFVISRYSYSGLRMMDLVVSWLTIWICRQIENSGGKLSRSGKLVLLTTGLIVVSGNVFGYYAAYGQGESPFLPFNWISSIAL
ncbi:EpsG family protein [Solirhodobacter olei]|uniref:EpsG family protein n=1 Tax=Solirhodobacter olei TaxID=2493082 RepID=UPI003BAC4AC2